MSLFVSVPKLLPKWFSSPLTQIDNSLHSKRRSQIGHIRICQVKNILKLLPEILGGIERWILWGFSSLKLGNRATCLPLTISSSSKHCYGNWQVISCVSHIDTCVPTQSQATACNWKERKSVCRLFLKLYFWKVFSLWDFWGNKIFMVWTNIKWSYFQLCPKHSSLHSSLKNRIGLKIHLKLWADELTEEIEKQRDGDNNNTNGEFTC